MSLIEGFVQLDISVNTDLLTFLLALLAHWLIILLFTLSFIAHYE